jgi:hypothetical protein
MNTLKLFNFKNLIKIKFKTIMTDQIRAKSTFETLKFDNLALKTLPIDSITDNYVREVRDACFSKVIHY